MKHFPLKILLLLFYFNSINSYGETFETSLEIKLDIEPVFNLTINTYLHPLEQTFSPKQLIKPSKNTIVPGKNLEGTIDLGYLIARKGEPLISEYKVLMKVQCETNNHQAYHVTQNLIAPIIGQKTGATFPEKAFVCEAEISPDEGQRSGNILIQNETPVISGQEIEIYRSDETGNDYLGNILNVYYWISDQQEDKVDISQRADTYSSTLIITMMEL